MTFLNAMPAGDPAPDNSPTHGDGPLVGIGLPHELAKTIAGTRPVIVLDPAAIETDGLGDLSGALVACPLLGGKADAVDVIGTLVRTGFRGGVIVVCPPVPNAGMIRAELKAVAKGLAITLIEM